MTDKIMIQALLIIAVLGILYAFIRSANQTYIQAFKRIGLLLFAAASVYAVLRPDDLSAIANLIGVGRGSDLLLYGLVVAFFAVVFSVYQRFRAVDRRYTDLARTVALRDAEALNTDRGLLDEPPPGTTPADGPEPT